MRIYSLITTTLLLSAITGLLIFLVISTDVLFIRITFGAMSLASSLMFFASLGSVYAKLRKPTKDLSWMQSTFFERTVNFKQRNKNVLHLEYDKRVVNITLDELYTRLKYDVENGKYNRVCNRDAWRSFGYHGNEIIAIKKYLLTIGVATGQETGSIKLLTSPASAIDVIRELNS